MKLKVKYCCHYLMISIILSACIGCAGVKFTQWHFPYMMEVQQGNYITHEQMQQLRLGLSKEQVSFVLGRPLTQFVYNQSRWDFFYQDYQNNSLKRQYKITLWFNKQNKLIKISSYGDLF